MSPIHKNKQVRQQIENFISEHKGETFTLRELKELLPTHNGDRIGQLLKNNPNIKRIVKGHGHDIKTYYTFLW